MTVLVCQDCEKTIEYMTDEKVRILYGKCSGCQQDSSTKKMENQA